MTNSNQLSFEFPALKSPSTSRKIEVQFSGGEVTSDAGALLLREVDKKLELTKRFSVHYGRKHSIYCDQSFWQR